MPKQALHMKEGSPLATANGKGGRVAQRQRATTYPTAVPLSELGNYAFYFAASGLAVGPLDGKRPLTKHGFKDFTTDTGLVISTWQRSPNLNIGARVPKGWVVIDIDPRNGGHTTWEELTAGHTVPSTIVTRTGGGGQHYWFKLPYDLPTKATLGAGIDIKTHSGYVVMPPSIHPDTKRLYQFQSAPPFEQVPRLPAWLCPHVYKPVKRPARPARSAAYSQQGTITGLINTVAKAVEGERNSTLYWAACRAYEQGLEATDLIPAAQATGLAESEITATLRSARGTVGATL